jgi:hypothetical protein
MQVGGTYFRAIKLLLKAKVLDNKSFYPLIDSYVSIIDGSTCNEVKR